MSFSLVGSLSRCHFNAFHTRGKLPTKIVFHGELYSLHHVGHAWGESSRQIKPVGDNCLKATIRWASLGRHVWGLHVLE